jgi:hypothetical protein
MYLSGNARVLRYAASVLIVTGGAALYRSAFAAPSGAGERAKSILTEVEAEPAGRELAAPGVAHARDRLARAEAASEPAHAAILQDTALEWAEVARDLKRAGLAEQASDRLEQEASALQTELASLRAAVEQAMARLGQARHDVAELETSKSGRAAPAPASPAAGPTPAPSGERR